ncbi:MAG: hypothetical protein GIW98_02535 [Candidatus Eremiobacteraeota bacterium]|nr:hypothetical protein [Candidatus Eremiobacteraeota bacterium]
MFEAKDDAAPNGHPLLERHEHFAWRNGNQVMSVSEGEGISATEIEAIRVAMHGDVLPRRELHAPDSGRSFELHVIPKP